MVTHKISPYIIIPFFPQEKEHFPTVDVAGKV